MSSPPPPSGPPRSPRPPPFSSSFSSRTPTNPSSTATGTAAATMERRAFSHGPPSRPSPRLDLTTPASPGGASPQLIPDDDEEGDGATAGGIPMTGAASVMMTNIPRTSIEALNEAFAPDNRKINIRFLAVGSTPSLKRNLFQLTASKKFSMVVSFLRKRLNLKQTDNLFAYVNSTFAPALDEEVGNLWKCYRVKDELVVNYCINPAFG